MWDFITPAFGSGVVVGVVGVFRGMSWVSWWEEGVGETGLVVRGRVVEVDVEKKLVLCVWEALAEFALDSAVAGTDVVLEDFAENETDVFHFCELGC